MELPGRKREINRKRRCGAFFVFCCAPEYPLEKIRRMARSDEPKADEKTLF